MRYFFGHCTEVTALPRASKAMGRDICPFWRETWKMSAWVAAAWQGLTDMKRKTITIRSGSYELSRASGDAATAAYQAVWRPDIPAVASKNGSKA
ncbi:hypothetical protein MJ524_16965 [Escherichia coli]|nr:hypothetical protein MJ524_16965 [Escherichia coli]